MKTTKYKIIIITLCLVLVFAVCGMYLGDYYRADAKAIEAFSYDTNVEKAVISENAVAYIPENVKAGFLFYPGGKVEYEAYAPLMQACAEQGILCALFRMPFNLAVLDIDAVESMVGQYAEIERWYMGGHSLGGSMAASYIAEHAEHFDGLILLASYSTADLSGSDLEVLSIYGTEDAVMNREKYTQYSANLPEGFTELIIQGGNHAGFGLYGAQEGDGTARITSEEQIRLTAKAVAEFIA